MAAPLTGTTRRGRLWRFVSIALMALIVGPIVYFSIPETWIYINRSEARAVDAASSKVRRVCASVGLDPRSFSGPVPIPQASQSFMFVWRRGEGEEVTVSIMYLPYDIE